MVCSWFFERRLWCRYLCPIGGMNGLFAKGAMTELRARQGVCASSCSTYHCFKVRVCVWCFLCGGGREGAH